MEQEENKDLALENQEIIENQAENQELETSVEGTDDTEDAEISFEDIPLTIEKLLSEGESRWDEEWQNHVLKQALEDLRSAVSALVYQAFSMLSLEGMSGKEVAATLGITTNAVYVYKHEALNKLKNLIAEVDE